MVYYDENENFGDRGGRGSGENSVSRDNMDIVRDMVVDIGVGENCGNRCG